MLLLLLVPLPPPPPPPPPLLPPLLPPPLLLLLLLLLLFLLLLTIPMAQAIVTRLGAARSLALARRSVRDRFTSYASANLLKENVSQATHKTAHRARS